MADVLTEIGGTPLTLRAVGMILTALVLLLFAFLRRRMIEPVKDRIGALRNWADGIGFGLLPALAVLKLFENIYTGTGAEVTEPLPLLPFLTAEGRYLPCAAESAVGLICFAGICVWLMIRKEAEVGKGDLLMISLSLWCGIRMVTEGLREAPNELLRSVFCGGLVICLAVWTSRLPRHSHGRKRALGALLAAVLCAALAALTGRGTLSVGSGIGDLAVIAGCAILTAMLTLMTGSDSRAAIG